MRKLMFSLVATLAFGSFAMANNVEVETVEVETVKAVSVETAVAVNFEFKIIEEEETMIPSCADAAMNFLDAIDPAGVLSQEQAIYHFQAFERLCEIIRHFNGI